MSKTERNLVRLHNDGDPMAGFWWLVLYGLPRKLGLRPARGRRSS